MYLLIGFKKSTPPQNRQLIVGDLHAMRPVHAPGRARDACIQVSDLSFLNVYTILTGLAIQEVWIIWITAILPSLVDDSPFRFRTNLISENEY